MFESKPLAENLPHESNSAANSPDLDQRLGLYRVFLKLYEHHRDLLDEILDLENADGRYRNRGVWQYIQGGVQGNQAYLTTNLLQEQTCNLYQPQHIWIIGRDRKVSLSVPDKRLSRRHAMVQYVPDKGFYLVDLNSTNGTYVNGEAIRHPVLLKDGDRIRLGSLSFIFYYYQEAIVLEALPLNLFNELSILEPTNIAHEPLDAVHTIEFLAAGGWDEPFAEESLPENEKETSMFLKASQVRTDDPLESLTPQLSTDQKADILDRFLNR